MRIDFLYFKDCPNSTPTLRCLREVLGSADVCANVNEIEIADAADATRYRFLGSPSIRIDDQDIDPDARTHQDFGLICRTYPGGTRIPAADMIQRALQERLSDEDARRGVV